MVSKYDIFYVIATKGEVKINEIVSALNKPKKDYNAIFNHVLELEKDIYVKRNGNVSVVHNKRSEKLFSLISFCIRNGINYNILFKKSMITFLEKSCKHEFFTIKNVKVHPQTFSLYVDALSKYGFLFVISKKPLRCKLLRHHFLMDLFEFFGKKARFYIPKKTDLIGDIKKELKKYRRNKKIHYTVLEDIEKKEKISFIYSSLNLEGNPLTLPETQKLLADNLVPEKYSLQNIQEVTNYKKAIDLMISNAKRKAKLNLDLILNYHKIAMGTIHGAGEIRRQNVRIKLNPHFKTSDWHLIPKKMNDLMERYDKFRSKELKKIIESASFFHNKFQRIHPFIDGNSRTSRLLMLHILRSYDIPLLDLPIGYFDLYLDLTKRSKKRDDESFNYLIQEIILMNLKKVNGSIGL
ncbi:MAG: Fic family protein [Candidatus Woesearchaeota archaeon]